jgi:RecJ-like exonuclease
MSNFTRLNGIEKPSKTVACKCHRCYGSGTFASYGQCYRCGGNGRDPQDRAYGFPAGWSDDECQTWLDQQAARNDARRKKSAAKRRAQQDAVFAENLAACHALEDLHRLVEEVPVDSGQRRWLTSWEYKFAIDTRVRAFRYTLSEKQIALVASVVEKVAERKAKAAAEAETLVDAPEGRLEIAGEILSIKEYDSDFGRVTKILVRCEGYKAFGTAPAPVVADVERGDHISLTATLKPKERGFATFSRPTKPTLTKVVA